MVRILRFFFALDWGLMAMARAKAHGMRWIGTWNANIMTMGYRMALAWSGQKWSISTDGFAFFLLHRRGA